MEKNIETLFSILQKQFSGNDFSLSVDNEKSTIRIDFPSNTEGVTISAPPLVAKWERVGDKAIEEIVYYVKETALAKQQTLSSNSNEWNVYPIIRSTSFPLENGAKESYVYFEHTAETRILLAVDQGNTYRIVTENDCKQAAVTKEELYSRAMLALQGLSTASKKDEVAGNNFYFINTNDGYDASRMLNQSLMNSFKEQVKGEMVVAVPHADVCIIADIRNEVGYDVISQIAMGFFMKGTIPITALSFVYENGQFEPLFILGKKKRTK